MCGRDYKGLNLFTAPIIHLIIRDRGLKKQGEVRYKLAHNV